MELFKPTALAAFAPKQQCAERLDGRSIIDDGSSLGKTLAQFKVPTLKTLRDDTVDTAPKHVKELKPLGSCGVLASPMKPLEALKELGPSRGSFSHKVVGISSAFTPMSPFKSMDMNKISTDNHAEQTKTQTVALPPRKRLVPVKSDKNRDAGGSSTTTNDGAQKDPGQITTQVVHEVVASGPVTSSTSDNPLTDTKVPVHSDKSDDEDFNFDDVDDEKEDATTTAELLEEEERQPPAIEAKPTAVDIEGLYDCPSDASSETSPYQQHREPKMFLPRASDIDLFHLVLTADTDQLKRFLAEKCPQDLLDVVDTTGRTLYHYAALSKDKLVRDMIFQHVNSYHDAQFESDLQALMRTKAQMNAWMQGSEGKRNGWVPPRVKELQREMTKQKCADWANICSKVDENGRSLFHYLATTKSLLSVEDDYEFCSVLRTQSRLLSTKDNFKKLALHYAVETGNLKQVKWYFQMGITVSQADVDLLLLLNVSRAMETVLLRQLEAIDLQNYYLATSKHHADNSDDFCDPGVSTFVLAKLQRITDDSAGRLHQLPLHRAAMFGNIRAVELLLEDGADPRARDANQWTPLHYCADEATVNHLSIAQLLMDSSKSVDINAKSLKGRSPLHVAVRSRRRNRDDNIQSMMALDSQERVSFIAYLHECKAELDLKDKHGATPLLLACRGEDVDVTRFLLRSGCNPSVTGENKWNPLHFAAIRGNPNMIDFLLSWDADSRLWIGMPDIQGRKPIDVATNDRVRQMLINLWTECFNGNVDQVRRLLLVRPTRNPQSSGHAVVVSVKDKTTQTKRTPLHFVILGYLDALQALEPSRLQRRERFKQTKASERSRTASSRYLQTAVLLLQAGADLCAADKWGITPLMLAASMKDVIFMETLLDRLSDGNNLLVGDADGNTALHYSYAFCQAQMSTILEEQMEDEEIENTKGKSPFEMTGSRDKIYPKAYREFLRQQQDLMTKL